MSKSISLRAAEVRQILGIVEECRELGDDVHAWRTHAGRRVARLVDADVVMSGELSGFGTNEIIGLGATLVGFEQGFNPEGFARSVELLAEDPTCSASVAMREYGLKSRNEDGSSRTRSQLLSDAEWYSSLEYDYVFRTIGINHALWCFARVPGDTAVSAGAAFARAEGRRDFDGRALTIVHEFQRAIAPLVGKALARYGDPSPRELPPRVRSVLRCMLEGDSDRQIAARLGLTRHTVNQYSKQIFKHFGVGSRYALLGRWVSRGWTNRFAWDESPSREPIRP